VAEDLEARLGVPIRLDVRALRDIEIQPDALITFAASKIAARSAIDLMLRPLSLTAVIRYEVLLITTVEEADNMLDTRVYDTSDLTSKSVKTSRDAGVSSMFSVTGVSPTPATGTAMPSSSNQPANKATSQKGKPAKKYVPAVRSGTDLDLLANAIAANIRSTSWGGNGGPGTIVPFESPGIKAIVVNQTQAAHAQIESFLSQLRAIRDTPTHSHAGL
jgi:hypothetical protein